MNRSTQGAEGVSVVRHTRRTVFLLALISGIFAACYKAVDNIVVHNYIVAAPNHELTAASTYLIFGGWTGAILSVILGQLFGRRLVDHQFRGLIFRNKRMHLQALITGGLSAAGTLALLRGNQEADPSVVVTLGALVLFYTAPYDLYKKQLRPGEIGFPVLAAVLGCALVVYRGEWKWDPIAALVVSVLLVSNPLNALSEVLEQQGGRQTDGVNFHIWRFFYLAFTGTVIAVVLAFLQQEQALLAAKLTEAVHSKETWILVLLTMFLVFFAITLKIVAKKPGGSAVSYVLLISQSLQILMALPITLIGAAFNNRIFGGVPDDPQVWVVRTIGVVIVVWAVFVRLRKKGEQAA